MPCLGIKAVEVEPRMPSGTAAENDVHQQISFQAYTAQYLCVPTSGQLSDAPCSHVKPHEVPRLGQGIRHIWTLQLKGGPTGTAQQPCHADTGEMLQATAVAAVQA